MESLFRERTMDLLFPTPVYTVQLDENECKSASEFILQKINSNEAMRQMLEKTGGSTTEDNLQNEPELNSIFNTIEEEVRLYSDLHLGIKPDSLKLTCSWSNVHASGFRHIMHCHPNSTISGVLYLNVPDCEYKGNLTFADPRPAKKMVEMDYHSQSLISSRMIEYVPATGKLVLFPSWLEHGTELFKGDGNRVSLSFNYNLVSCNRHSFKV
jgi:uncharacterized protein (TIGR02466 family)